MADRPRICLIDDDLLVRDAVSIGLEDAGFDVATADSVKAGLDHVSRNGTDAIVTDMNMPDGGGAALIAAVRARWPDMPVVAISGGGEIDGRDAAELARASGAHVCLVKPFRARDIAAALARLLPTG